jgi:CRP-like cAMP-binding protein
MICQAGSYVAGIHLIVQGIVSDMMLTMRGEDRDGNILGAGDLIGLEILGNNFDGLSISLCRAVTAVELLFIERSHLESALNDDPALQQALFQYAVSRYVATRKDPRQRESVEAQLCRLLLRLGEACGLAASGSSIILPIEITLRTLGEVLCISSRQLRHARQAVHSLEISDSGIEFDMSEARRMINDECTATA